MHIVGLVIKYQLHVIKYLDSLLTPCKGFELSVQQLTAFNLITTTSGLYLSAIRLKQKYI